MKLLKTLSIIPIAALVASCAQPNMSVKTDLVSKTQTQAPTNFVVYPDDRPSIPDGQALWAKLSADKDPAAAKMNCAACHGATGSGGSASVNLGDAREAARTKPVELYKFLAFGDPKSGHEPLLHHMSSREVWSLAMYARSLAIKPLEQKELDYIQPIFGANCAVCHGTKGDGDGPLARNLEPLPANFQTFRRFYDRTDEVLFDHIANGIKWEGMPNFLGKQALAGDKKTIFKFDHANINKLVLYVRNFHISNQPTIPVKTAEQDMNVPGLTGASTTGGGRQAEPKPTPDATSTAAPTGGTPATTTESSGSAEVSGMQKPEAPASGKPASAAGETSPQEPKGGSGK